MWSRDFCNRRSGRCASDLGTWIKNQITRQEKFQSDMLPLVVSADSADLEPSGDPNVSTVLLHGMAAAQLDHDRPTSMVIAQEGAGL